MPDKTVLKIMSSGRAIAGDLLNFLGRLEA
jgi:hypothetical protein